MLVKGTKWDAAENILRWLIRSDIVYCESCGSLQLDGVLCCEDPLLGTHKSHLKGHIRALREYNKVNHNAFGESKGKNMRACLSIPRRLLWEWTQIFEKQFGEKLFRSEDARLHKIDVRNAMRRFPYLRRCDVV